MYDQQEGSWEEVTYVQSLTDRNAHSIIIHVPGAPNRGSRNAHVCLCMPNKRHARDLPTNYYYENSQLQKTREKKPETISL